MLDIKFIRENLDIVKMAAKKKHIKVDLNALVALDDSRREMMSSIEAKKAEQNRVSADIVGAQDPVVKQQLIAEMQDLKAEMIADEEKLKPLLSQWQELMLQVPNIPDMSVPDGDSDADNVEIKTWGEKPSFPFEPKDHVEIMTKLNMVDFERGSKVHGFRGYY